MTQFEIDASRAENENKDFGSQGLRSTYQKKEMEKASHNLGIENQNLLKGVVNNEILIPRVYYEKMMEERQEEKNKILDKMSKLLSSPVEQAVDL